MADEDRTAETNNFIESQKAFCLHGGWARNLFEKC